MYPRKKGSERLDNLPKDTHLEAENWDPNLRFLITKIISLILCNVLHLVLEH